MVKVVSEQVSFWTPKRSCYYGIGQERYKNNIITFFVQLRQLLRSSLSISAGRKIKMKKKHHQKLWMKKRGERCVEEEGGIAKATSTAEFPIPPFRSKYQQLLSD